jgi:hypothetical protein
VSDQDVVIKKVDQSCAAAVPGVFRAIYGDAFPVQYVYNADLIMAEIEGGRLDASLAFGAGAEPVGYVALYKNAPNPQLWEGGNLLVMPGSAGNNLAWLLLQHYAQPENTPTVGSDGIFDEAVCHHYFTQMGGVKCGFGDYALMLDQVNGASFQEHGPETERVACLLQFLEQSDPPDLCYLPEQYLNQLQRLLTPLRPRTVLPGSAPLPVTGETTSSETWFSDAGTWRISVSTIGINWPAFLDQLLEQARQRQVVSLQVVLSAGLDCMTAAVQEMRQRGFFLGGLFPRWFGSDGVMLQQVLGKEPDYDGIKLYSPVAKQLLEFIRNDRESLQS